MTKKVVHLVYSFGCGGLEKVIANLINHSTQYDVEHVVISLTNDVTMAQQVNLPIKVIVLDKKHGNDINSHKKLFSLLKELKPQAINTYNFGTIEYHLTAKLAGVPVRVHSDHGRGGDDPDGKNTLHNLFRKFIAHFITEYIVVSRDLYEWVSKSLKINRRLISLVFNGVIVPSDAKYIEESPVRFVTIGRLDEVKNQKLLINAFAKAVNEQAAFNQCKLQIVGDGPLFDELQAQITQLKMQDSISLLGYREDIAEILSVSDVFVLSSIYEAMPMTILEAMANKTPVICTNVGGISQFITEQEAWFVESRNIDKLSDKLVEVKIEDAKRHQKSMNGYKLVDENYGVDVMVKEYMDKYKVLLRS